jgi:hypothetical protein
LYPRSVNIFCPLKTASLPEEPQAALLIVLRLAVCGGVPESVAVTVKVQVPAVMGVPEIIPELLNESPAGRVPLVTLQVMGGVPPVAWSVAL